MNDGIPARNTVGTSGIVKKHQLLSEINRVSEVLHDTTTAASAEL